MGLRHLPPPPPSPPKQFSIKITSQLEYIKNPVYVKAVRDKQEPFRPPGESVTYTVEVERDVWSLEGQEPDPDKLDDDLLGSSFQRIIKGILTDMIALLKADMPLCGVDYTVKVHHTVFSVGWSNSRDQQLWEKVIRVPSPDTEPVGSIPGKEAIQALLDHHSNSPLTSNWYAKLTLNVILGPDPKVLEALPLSAAPPTQPAHIAWYAQHQAGVAMPPTAPARPSRIPTNQMVQELNQRREADLQHHQTTGKVSHDMAFNKLVQRWTCRAGGSSRGSCKAWVPGDKFRWCYYFDGSSEHFRLTTTDIGDWASAWRRGIEGVSEDRPPPNLLMKLLGRGKEDVGLDALYNPRSQSRRPRGSNTVPNIYVVAGNNYHGPPGGVLDWTLLSEGRGYSSVPTLGQNAYTPGLQQSIEIPIRSSSLPIPLEDSIQRRDLIRECINRFQGMYLLGPSNIPTRMLLRSVHRSAIDDSLTLGDFWRKPNEYYTHYGLEESLVISLKRYMKEFLKAEVELWEDEAVEALLSGHTTAPANVPVPTFGTYY